MRGSIQEKNPRRWVDTVMNTSCESALRSIHQIAKLLNKPVLGMCLKQTDYIQVVTSGYSEINGS
jgi:hypothetical protein